LFLQKCSIRVERLRSCIVQPLLFHRELSISPSQCPGTEADDNIPVSDSGEAMNQASLPLSEYPTLTAGNEELLRSRKPS